MPFSGSKERKHRTPLTSKKNLSLLNKLNKAYGHTTTENESRAIYSIAKRAANRLSKKTDENAFCLTGRPIPPHLSGAAPFPTSKEGGLDVGAIHELPFYTKSPPYW